MKHLRFEVRVVSSCYVSPSFPSHTFSLPFCTSLLSPIALARSAELCTRRRSFALKGFFFHGHVLLPFRLLIFFGLFGAIFFREELVRDIPFPMILFPLLFWDIPQFVQPRPSSFATGPSAPLRRGEFFRAVPPSAFKRGLALFLFMPAPPSAAPRSRKLSLSAP